jgi:hypothetical protein
MCEDEAAELLDRLENGMVSGTTWECRSMALMRRSIEADARRLDHLAPLDDFLADMDGQRLRRAAIRRSAATNDEEAECRP